MCNQNKEHHHILNDLASRMGLKKDAFGNCVNINTAMEVVPRKAKGKRGVGPLLLQAMPHAAETLEAQQEMGVPCARTTRLAPPMLGNTHPK